MHVASRGQQLPRRARIAQLPAAFAEESDLSLLHVQARAHAVAVAGRARHGNRRRQGDPADARQAVGDDVALDGELAGVVDVRVEIAAARGIGGGCRRSGDGSSTDTRVGERHALGDPLDARGDLLAGNGAADQHDLPVERERSSGRRRPASRFVNDTSVPADTISEIRARAIDCAPARAFGAG